MRAKIMQFIPTLLVLVAIGFRHLSNWCIDSIPSCYGTLLHQIAITFTKPLYNFSLYLLPIVIILVFVPRATFISWLKLAAWVIPLAIIFIAMTPVTSNAYMDFFPFYRDDAARLSAEIFTGLSLALIIWKHFSTRAKQS